MRKLTGWLVALLADGFTFLDKTILGRSCRLSVFDEVESNM